MGAFDIVGVVLGVLGAVGVFQMLYSWLYNNLPAQRMKILEDTLSDTRLLFRAVIEEGLIPEAGVLHALENRLLRLRRATDGLRTQSHCATSFTQQCSTMISGLSRVIRSVCIEIEELRAEISSISDAQRRSMIQAGLPVKPPMYPIYKAQEAREKKLYRRIRRRAPFYRLLPSSPPPDAENVLPVTNDMALTATPPDFSFTDRVEVTMNDETIELSCFNPTLLRETNSSAGIPSTSGSNPSTSQVVSSPGYHISTAALASQDHALQAPGFTPNTLYDTIRTLTNSVSTLTSAISKRNWRAALPNTRPSDDRVGLISLDQAEAAIPAGTSGSLYGSELSLDDGYPGANLHSHGSNDAPTSSTALEGAMHSLTSFVGLSHEHVHDKTS